MVTPTGERFMNMSSSSEVYHDIFSLGKLANSILYCDVVFC